MSGNFKEKEEKRIEMKSFSDKAVEMFIKFLYGFELEVDDLNNNVNLSKELIAMGGLYNVSGIQAAAAKFLKKHFTAENMVELMDFLKTNNAVEATEICSDFIANKFHLKTIRSTKILDRHPEIAVKLINRVQSVTTSTKLPKPGQWRWRLTSPQPQQNCPKPGQWRLFK